MVKASRNKTSSQGPSRRTVAEPRVDMLDSTNLSKRALYGPHRHQISMVYSSMVHVAAGGEGSIAMTNGTSRPYSQWSLKLILESPPSTRGGRSSWSSCTVGAARSQHRPETGLDLVAPGPEPTWPLLRWSSRPVGRGFVGDRRGGASEGAEVTSGWWRVVREEITARCGPPQLLYLIRRVVPGPSKPHEGGHR